MVNDAFLPSFGNRPTQLVGRAAELAEFIDALGQPPGHPDRVCVYTGQRGMGKTAMLLELEDRAHAAGFVVARAAANERILEELLELIQIGGAAKLPAGKRLKGFSVGALGFSLGLTFTDEVRQNYGFRVKLSLLSDALAQVGLGVALLVDEITATSPQLRELATSFQQLRGDGKNIALAMAGLPAAVSSVLNDDVLTFLNRARKVQLGPLPLNDVAVFYAQAFTRAGKSFTSESLDVAVKASQGYPYLMQLLGYHVLGLLGDAPEVTPAIAEAAAVNSRRDLAETVHVPAARSLSRRDMEFLRAMAADPGPSQITDIAKRLGSTPGAVQQQRRRLIQAGVIAPARRGEVEFVLPHMSDYLANHAAQP